MCYHNPVMLIFVYGDDGARVTEKVRELRTRFLEKFDASGMNLAEFPAPGATELPFAEIVQAIQSAPFLSEKRMVIVRGLLEATKKPDHERWIGALHHVPASTITVIAEDLDAKAVEKHGIFTVVKDVAETHSYAQTKLAGAALTKWITERAAKQGATIDGATANALVARVGDDLYRLGNEVDKLAAYAQGSVTTVTLDLLTPRDASSNIFGLVDAIADRNVGTALRMLDDERNAGSADLYIMAMIARQVRLLLQVKHYGQEHGTADKAAVAAALALHPFVAGKTVAQAAKYSLPALVHLHTFLTGLDRDAKRGKVDPSVAIDRLVAEMVMATGKNLDDHPAFR